MKARNTGFSLVEVLVALVVMSVGMLGIAGLYVQSLQAGRTSMFRHHAVMIVGDVADRIRANPTAGIAYTPIDGADNSCVDGNINCTPAQMAAHDILLWKNQVESVLPIGTVRVVLDNGVVPPTYEITVSWTEPDETKTYAVTIPVLGL